MKTQVDTQFFRALGDPTRGQIFLKLLETGCSCTVSQVADCCTVDLSVVSRHLAKLREAGVVEATRKGKEVYYSVRYPEIVNALRALADSIENCCPNNGESCCEVTFPQSSEEQKDE